MLNKIVGDKFKSSPTIRKWNKVIGKFEHLASLGLHVEEIKKERPEGDVSHSRLKNGSLLTMSRRDVHQPIRTAASPHGLESWQTAPAHENKYAKHI